MEAFERYLATLYEEDRVLAHVLAEIRRNGMPDISIAPPFGKLLTLLVRTANARNALEIGALGGYSGVCIARGLAEGGRLLSLELEPAYAEVARRNMEEAGFGEVVEYRLGEALMNLERLFREGARFDFFLIDADKGNYPNYLEWAIRLAQPGALIVGDNALLRGRVADPNVDSPSVRAMRQFNETIARHPQLDGTLLPAYDGLVVARVKSGA